MTWSRHDPISDFFSEATCSLMMLPEQTHMFIHQPGNTLLGHFTAVRPVLIKTRFLTYAAKIFASFPQVWFTQQYNASMKGQRRLDQWKNWRRIILE